MRRSLVGSKASAAFTRVLEDSPNSLSSKRLRNQPLSSLRYIAILPKRFEVSGPETETDSVKLGPVSTLACALILSVELGSVVRMRTAPAVTLRPKSSPCGPRSTSTPSMSKLSSARPEPTPAKTPSTNTPTVGVLDGIELLIAMPRSEEHTSELQSLMRISYAVFCLQKKTKHTHNNHLTNKHN